MGGVCGSMYVVGVVLRTYVCADCVCCECKQPLIQVKLVKMGNQHNNNNNNNNNNNK